MSWFRKRKHQFRGVLAFLHPQFLHYSQLAAVLEAPYLSRRFHRPMLPQWEQASFDRCPLANRRRTVASAMRLTGRFHWPMVPSRNKRPSIVALQRIAVEPRLTPCG